MIDIERLYATGINTYGNRSAAFPTSTAKENSIHVQRILDAAHEATLFYGLEYVDKLSLPENQERFVEAVNKFLRTKIGRGEQSWFYDAIFSLPRELNTVEEMADNKFKYKLLTKLVDVMKRLTIYSEIDLTLRNRLAYVVRDTSDLLPTTVYIADGKSFDAEVAHPRHGKPYRYRPCDRYGSCLCFGRF